MAKMINVDELIEFCNTERSMLHAHNNSVACAALRRVIEFAKEYAVEAEPVVHGHWISDYAEGRKIYNAHCSECGKEPTRNIGGDYYIDKLSDFCPNCGARMGGGSE